MLTVVWKEKKRHGFIEANSIVAMKEVFFSPILKIIMGIWTEL